MPHVTRRTALAGLSAVATTAVLPVDRALAAWPDRNITLMHGLTAGGGVDVTARLIAAGLSRRLGQQVVVETRPGASGTIAAAQISRAKPDGYTLGFVPTSHAVSAAMYKSLPFNAVDSFTIVGQVDESPFVLVTYGDSPLHTLTDLIKTARERPTPLLCGVPGQGTPQHLLIEYLSRLANIKVQVVPFHGGNQALTELLGKRLDFLIDPPIALVSQIKSGALRAIGVTGPKHFAALPDVSTVAEAGFPGFSVTSWMGIIAPPHLPNDITARVNRELNGLLVEPAVVERMRALGSEPKGGTPDDFKKQIATDVARWNKVIDDAKIQRI